MPQIVLWIYFEGNDIKNLIEEKEAPILLNYLNREFSQGLLTRQSEIDQVLINYIQAKEIEALSTSNINTLSRLRRILLLYDVRQLLLPDEKRRTIKDAPPPPPLFSEILTEAKVSVNS